MHQVENLATTLGCTEVFSVLAVAVFTLSVFGVLGDSLVLPDIFPDHPVLSDAPVTGIRVCLYSLGGCTSETA